MKKICVFCGAHSGGNKAFYEDAKKLGELFSKEQFDLVYGGGNTGMMGEIANSVLNTGGNVTGIITEHLVPIEGYTELKDLRIVKTMHERKSMMYDLSDGFAVLPGGIGTLDEFFEILTWARLKFHSKPIGILNTANYYNRLLHFLHHVADESFLKREQLDLFFVADTPSKLIEGLKQKL